MAEKKIPNKQRLAALFASFSILIMGTSSLMRSMSIDYYTVVGTLIKIVPACIAMGLLGWVMGTILDQPKRRTKVSYGAHFADEIAKVGNEAPLTEGL